jgi:hypothetical protein
MAQTFYMEIVSGLCQSMVIPLFTITASFSAYCNESNGDKRSGYSLAVKFILEHQLLLHVFYMKCDSYAVYYKSYYHSLKCNYSLTSKFKTFLKTLGKKLKIKFTTCFGQYGYHQVLNVFVGETAA